MKTLSDTLEAWRPGISPDWMAQLAAPQISEVGRITRIADGIIELTGLPSIRPDELLAFPGDIMGFAKTLDPDVVGCVMLDPPAALNPGDLVRSTSRTVSVPVGDALLGRVIDPLGRPHDGKPPIQTRERSAIEQPAPDVMHRNLIKDPLETGITIVDAMFAIGRGQRELIIGDRSSGKTALAVDTIINQRNTEVICVYVSIGQKLSDIRSVIDTVHTHGMTERTVIVASQSSAPPGLQWIAPYAGFAIAEYFRDKGKHVLIVLDDLTKHAAVHREISLLLRQPPGREAYPGDIFHIHARMLERAAQLLPEHGGGSLTALPIAETQAGNLSAYIPTNLISITDGQIYLDSKLFSNGIKPAVDVGRSVSRVGGKAQRPALRSVAAGLRLDYAQFLELEVFTRFGAVVDPHTKDIIEHGRRIRGTLAQGRHAPLSMSAQVALLLALNEGLLDTCTPADVEAFKSRLVDCLHQHTADELTEIATKGTLSDANRDALILAMTALSRQITGQPSDTAP